MAWGKWERPEAYHRLEHHSADVSAAAHCLKRPSENIERRARRMTGEALSRIVGEITSVVGNIEDISSASREQSDGITSVTQATSQMDIATQQNAVLAEQSAQSAEKLAESAAQLRDLVAQFSIGQKKTGGHRGAQEMRWAG